MLCKSCGYKLKEAHKFCGGCGAKANSNLSNSIDRSSESNIVVPLKMGLSTMPIEISKVKIAGPESDNSYFITISSSFKNDEKEDWDFLQIKTHLLNSDGLVLREEIDTVDKLVEVNETYEHETNMWSMPAPLFGEYPEKVSVVVSAVASQKHIHEFQEFPIPSKANEIANIAPPCLIGPALKLLSASMWRSQPDEDKESSIEINFLFQNLEAIMLPEVRLIADIVDKKGKTLTETGNSKEIQPGELTQLAGYGRLKETKLVGAKLKFSLQTYYPVSAAVKGKLGGELVSVESNDVAWPFDDHGDDVAESNNQNDDTESSGSIKTFEWSMKLGEINMDDVEDGEVLSALKNSLKLAKAKKFEDAVNALPHIDFEYSFSNLDSDASDYFAETEGISFGLDPSNSKHTIQVGVSGGKLNLSVAVVFDIPVKDGVNLDELNEWLGENGGYAAGFASGGWSYNGDEGGEMLSVDPLSNYSSSEVSLEGAIKWGYSNDDVEIENLPPEFAKAKKLWATKKSENIMKAGELISPFIVCVFVEGNCDGNLTELFSQSMDEIEADSVFVYGVDFSDSNLPKVKASARFGGIKSNGLLDKKRLDTWQDENGFLDSCISFEWRIDGVDEDLDLRSWNHSGLSFSLLD